MAPKKNPSLSSCKSFEDFQKELAVKGFTLSPAPGSEKNMKLHYGWISTESWSSSRVIISLGQLKAGLPIPLYDPSNPLFYEALTKVHRGVFQLTGNSIRILNEFVLRSKGTGLSQVPKFAKPYDSTKYTVESFTENYSVHDSKKRKYQEWAIRFNRIILEDCDRMLLQDVDPNSYAKNDHLRLSNDEDWMMYPLILECPWVWGIDANGNVCTGQDAAHRFAAYEPWVLRWPEMPLRNDSVVPPIAPVTTSSKPSSSIRPRMRLNIAEMVKIKETTKSSTSSADKVISPPLKHRANLSKDSSSSGKDDLRSEIPTHPIPLVINLPDSPLQPLTDGPRGKKRKTVPSSVEGDDLYQLDLRFLKDAFVSARGNEAVDSSALDSLVSLCSDSFINNDRASLEKVSLSLSIQQHSVLMALSACQSR